MWVLRMPIKMQKYTFSGYILSICLALLLFCRPFKNNPIATPFKSMTACIK